MATIHYPENVPTNQKLQRLLRTVRKVLVFEGSTLVDIKSDGNVMFSLPESYRDHLLRFVWREDVIRLLLTHAGELQLSEDLADNLGMLLTYMDNILKHVAKEPWREIGEGSYRSQLFDSYLLIECRVGRHEPTNVRAWRRNNDMALEYDDIETCDWDAYERDLGGFWSGARMQYVMSENTRTVKHAQRLVKNAIDRYNPPVVTDPDFGYSYTEHLENQRDEGENLPGPSRDVVNEAVSANVAEKDKGKRKRNDVGDSGSEMDVDEDTRMRRGKGKSKARSKGKDNGKGKRKVRSRSQIQ
ncbi:hypothetical protein HD554DRAFT_2180939 [Boletus coccyginus]|nr:hypothetical protein HD554DRAFT_2180939 [Boletus coccyginus]